MALLQRMDSTSRTDLKQKFGTFLVGTKDTVNQVVQIWRPCGSRRSGHRRHARHTNNCAVMHTQMRPMSTRLMEERKTKKQRIQRRSVGTPGTCLDRLDQRFLWEEEVPSAQADSYSNGRCRHSNACYQCVNIG